MTSDLELRSSNLEPRASDLYDLLRPLLPTTYNLNLYDLLRPSTSASYGLDLYDLYDPKWTSNASFSPEIELLHVGLSRRKQTRLAVKIPPKSLQQILSSQGPTKRQEIRTRQC
jgi:hypothetical protein